MEEKAFVFSPSPRACTLFLSPDHVRPGPAAKGARVPQLRFHPSVRPSVKSFEFLIRRGVERVARVEHAGDDDDACGRRGLPIKSDLTCLAESESGGAIPAGGRDGAPSFFPPFRLWENSTEFLIFRCSPAARMPSPKGVQTQAAVLRRLACPLPGGPLLCMLISISFCLCVASDSNLPPIRRPKLNSERENSAESRARRHHDAVRLHLGLGLSPPSPFRYLSIGSTARPTHSTLPR